MSKINAPVKLEWDQRDGVKCNFGLLEIIRMSGDILLLNAEEGFFFDIF